MTETTRLRSVWCAEGQHLDCAAPETVCECSCHGATRRRPQAEKRTGFGKPGGTPAERPPESKPPRPNGPRAHRSTPRPLRPPRPDLPLVRPAIRKEDAACCILRALPDGRPVIGFCGPKCCRRPS